MSRVDAVARANLRRTNAFHPPATDRVKNPRPCGGKLKGVTIAAGDQSRTPSPLFGGSRRGQEIVGLVAGTLGVSKATGGDKLRNDGKLLQEFIIELAAALIRGERFVSIGRFFIGIPTNQNCAGLLLAVEPEQQIGKAKNGAAGTIATYPNTFR